MNEADLMASDPAREDSLVLVDGLDRETGVATKERAHREGLLHRAFSVVLVRARASDEAPSGYDGAGGPELLLVQRAACKYHSAGLWANSCCSHPRAGEDLMDAARRRVREELGCEADGLREIAAFAYRALFPDGICEHEYDHVLVGRASGEIAPDPAEVSAVRWVGVDELAFELAESPECFAAWAPMVLSMAIAELRDENPANR